MNFIAYTRVSTDQQADSGAGLKAQHDACRRYALGREHDVVMFGWAVFTDHAVSGTAPLDRRPGLLDAIAHLEKGDELVVAKRDRLGRDPIVVAMIEAAVKRRGARVVSAAGEGTGDDGPSGVLMRRLVDAFAEYERLLIGARTRAALQAKRERGECVGHVPFGKRRVQGGTLLADNADELETLSAMRAMRRRGTPLRVIAARLNASGVLNRGREWNHTIVMCLLRRGIISRSFRNLFPYT